jgi:hypothetical protein
MTEIGAQSRPAGLRDPNGGFQQKPMLKSTPLNVSSWSGAARKAERPLLRIKNLAMSVRHGADQVSVQRNGRRTSKLSKSNTGQRNL